MNYRSEVIGGIAIVLHSCRSAVIGGIPIVIHSSRREGIVPLALPLILCPSDVIGNSEALDEYRKHVEVIRDSFMEVCNSLNSFPVEQKSRSETERQAETVQT